MEKPANAKYFPEFIETKWCCQKLKDVNPNKNSVQNPVEICNL